MFTKTGIPHRAGGGFPPVTLKNEAGELPNKAVATSESKNEAGELPNWTVATSESKNKEEELPSRAVQKEAVA